MEVTEYSRLRFSSSELGAQSSNLNFKLGAVHKLFPAMALLHIINMFLVTPRWINICVTS